MSGPGPARHPAPPPHTARRDLGISPRRKPNFRSRAGPRRRAAAVSQASSRPGQRGVTQATGLRGQRQAWRPGLRPRPRPRPQPVSQTGHAHFWPNKPCPLLAQQQAPPPSRQPARPHPRTVDPPPTISSARLQEDRPALDCEPAQPRQKGPPLFHQRGHVLPTTQRVDRLSPAHTPISVPPPVDNPRPRPGWSAQGPAPSS